ncbi:M23 family metallopeptidase [Streptomyces zingiberis]|uniref:M23 family metallopeptidase n=1 Tax=Streptomyces zingiberis TaxID=2053010 RepID=A0ABX1BY90_9ACTN|nr:M23 family metallopeptidase [Streptomyces zingiberis]NJQ00279.1 M23 family metallopeptidase [Streptomyces zingiberis]
MARAGVSGAVSRPAGEVTEGGGPRLTSRLLRGGAAGIAGVLLTASPTWGAGVEAGHRDLTGRDTCGVSAPVHGGPYHGAPARAAGPGTDRGGPAHGGGDDRGSPAREPAHREPGGGTPGAGGEAWAPESSHPVAGAPVSAAYGVPGGWIAGHHTGIDFAVPVGTPVRSAGRGTVVTAGWAGSYGLLVTVRTPEGRYLLYAHLAGVSVGPGHRTAPGELLGHSGNTGRSSGPHLHFEVRQDTEYGSDIDPRSYLASQGVRL